MGQLDEPVIYFEASAPSHIQRLTFSFYIVAATESEKYPQLVDTINENDRMICATLTFYLTGRAVDGK